MLREHFVQKDPITAKPLEGLKIADVGCGGGFLAESLTRLGASVTAIDATEQAIKAATLHASQDPLLKDTINYKHMTVEDLLKESKENFDVVCSFEVIEHVSDVPKFIQSLCGLTKPGGTIFLSTINKTIISYAVAIIGAEYLLRWVPTNTHNWQKFVPPDDVKQILEQNKVAVQNMEGLYYDICKRRWLETYDTSVNYLVFATKQ